jgi:DNA transformation protein and related proteins
LPTSADLVAFVLDLLAPVGPVRARAMFGGHGLYARGVMFGLLDGDELFLKTDERSRATFLAAGCRRWTVVSRTQRMENTSYFRPPDEAHEDAESMYPWARLALDAALRARAEKAARAAAKAKAKRAPARGAAPDRRAPRRRKPASRRPRAR